MTDLVMEIILILHTSLFMMSDPENFTFVGTIQEVMLVKVPSDNVIVNEYRKLPLSSVRPITDKLQKLIEEGTKPKRGGKRKAKVGPSDVVRAPKKARKQAKKPRSPSSVVWENSKSRTLTEVRDKGTFHNEEDDIAVTSEPTPTETVPKVSSPVLTFNPVSVIFHTFTPPSSPIITTILISSIPPL